MVDFIDQQEDVGFDDQDGYFFIVELFFGVMGGFNKFVVQYGVDFMGFINVENVSGGCVVNNNVGYFEFSWCVLNYGVIKFGSGWDFGYFVVYELVEFYDVFVDDGECLSIVVCLVYNWLLVLSIVIEVGYSEIDCFWFDDFQDLGKFVIVQQWQVGLGYWVCLVICVYVVIFFGDEVEVVCGGEGIDGDVQIGVQIEVWW